MLFMETRLHKSHCLSCALKKHFLPGPRYLTGSVTHLKERSEVQGPTVLSGGRGCGLCDGDLRGRSQAALKRPLGKQLELLLPCWDKDTESSSCGQGPALGF